MSQLPGIWKGDLFQIPEVIYTLHYDFACKRLSDKDN